MDRLPVIAVTTELDMSTTDEFRAAIAAVPSTAERIVVDLTESGFVDSLGLTALVEVQAQLQEQGREIVLVAPRGTPAAQLLTLTQMRDQLPTYESRTAALEAE